MMKMNFFLLLALIGCLACRQEARVGSVSSDIQMEQDNVVDEEPATDYVEAVDSPVSEKAAERPKKLQTTKQGSGNNADQEPAPEKRPPVEEKPAYGDVIEQVGKDKSGEEETLGRHDAFDALLRKYVSTDGRVDYAGMRSRISELESYLQLLSAVDIKQLRRGEELAFWINAYNAFTIKMILDNYPLKSITDLHGGKPWDVKWISLNGQKLSLNQIENDIIRPKFNEPRIHFAVNCAAKSCPPLMNRAWTAENLESSLEKQTTDFINNSRYNSISRNRVAVSRIFDWYAADFGELIGFLQSYSKTPISDEARIEFLEYDWSLNN